MVKGEACANVLCIIVIISALLNLLDYHRDKSAFIITLSVCVCAAVLCVWSHQFVYVCYVYMYVAKKLAV